MHSQAVLFELAILVLWGNITIASIFKFWQCFCFFWVWNSAEKGTLVEEVAYYMNPMSQWVWGYKSEFESNTF